MRGVDISVPYTVRSGGWGGVTVKMPREIVPMILNAWMPPMMKQLMDGHRRWFR